MLSTSLPRITTNAARTAHFGSAALRRPTPAFILLARRSMATQGTKTILDTIKEDHKMLFGSYEQFEKHVGKDAGAMDRWSHQFMWTAARHAISEEIVIYPLMEKYLGEEGKKQADEDRAIHQKVKEYLYKAEGMKTDSAEHARLLKAAYDELWPHHTSEEEVEFPALEKAMSKADIESAVKYFDRIKLIVPTRPHPSAPDKPPFETLAGLFAMPIDKLKDAFASFPSDEELKAANVKVDNV